MKRINRLIFLAVSIVLIAGCTLVSNAGTEDVHHLIFASDLHATVTEAGLDDGGKVKKAFTGLPGDIEYVSFVGDMVGERGGDAPEYSADDVYDLVAEALSWPETGTFKGRFSIIWADHDKSVSDSNNIVKGKDGDTSGEIYEGKNSDGSTSYYIYSIGFYHMTTGGNVSIKAASEFKSWVSGKDESAPVIVLCHVPLWAKRGDNKGASYWNEALNYAATSGTSEVTRNVIYLCGHNHTVDSNEYVYNPGDTMSVQSDVEGRTPVGEDSTIYYNAMIPGYLKTSGDASLVTITDDSIEVTKYKGGEKQADWKTSDGAGTGSATVYISRVKKEEPAAKPKGRLIAKSVSKGKTSLNISWTKVKNVDGYDIFFNKCGKGIKYKKVKTIKGNKKFNWGKTGLKKNTPYKVFVRAYVFKDGKKKYVRKSNTAHTYTAGGNRKYTNAKSVTVKRTEVTVNKGKKVKIKASVKKANSKKKLVSTSHTARLRYRSSDKKVATVTENGYVKGVNKGTCKVYVLAHNGVYKKVTVTVK